MMKIDLNDTIAAVSTPIGEGGIGIVRMSGPHALKIADGMFVSRDGKRVLEFGTFTTHYGQIVDTGHKVTKTQGHRTQDTRYKAARSLTK